MNSKWLAALSPGRAEKPGPRKRLAVVSLCLMLAFVAVSCAPQADTTHPTTTVKEGKVAPPTPAVPDAFKDRIDAALDHVRHRDLLTSHGFWTIFHGILGMG